MGTSRPNQPQHNRPQQAQQHNKPQENQGTTLTAEVTTPKQFANEAEEAAFWDSPEGQDIALKAFLKKYPNTPPTEPEEMQAPKSEVKAGPPRILPFKGVVTHIVVEMLHGKLKPHEAEQYMHSWFDKLSPEEKQKFVAERNDHDATVNNLRGIMETVAQALPYLYAKD